MVRASRIRVAHLVLAALVCVVMFQLCSISASSALQAAEATTTTLTETVTVTSIQITVLEFTTATLPTYEWTTSTVTSATTTVSTMETTTISTVVSTQVQFRASEMTYTTSTTFVGVSWPSQGVLGFGILALFFLGLALGFFSAGNVGQAERIGGLLAAVGFIFWGIIQLFSGFSTEFSKLGFPGALDYVWWLVVAIIIGMFAGYYPALRDRYRLVVLPLAGLLLTRVSLSILESYLPPWFDSTFAWASAILVGMVLAMIWLLCYVWLENRKPIPRQKASSSLVVGTS